MSVIDTHLMFIASFKDIDHDYHSLALGFRGGEARTLWIWATYKAELVTAELI